MYDLIWSLDVAMIAMMINYWLLFSMLVFINVRLLLSVTINKIGEIFSCPFVYSELDS